MIRIATVLDLKRKILETKKILIKFFKKWVILKHTLLLIMIHINSKYKKWSSITIIKKIIYTCSKKFK